MPIAVSAALADGSRFSLARAILLYSDGQSAIATLHEVRNDDQRAEIGPGRPATLDELAQIARQLLDSQPDGDFLTESCLATGVRRTVWWCRPSRRRTFFRSLDAPAGSANRPEASSGPMAVEVPHPGLVFVVSGRTLSVYAVKGRSRPKPTTKLYRAPYPNVYSNGSVCLGSAKLPDNHSPSYIPEWESGFFESEFTHANAGGTPLTAFKGGVFGLWKHIADGNPFPTDSLVSTGMTLADVLAGKER